MTRTLSAARFEMGFDRFQRYQRAAEIIESLRTTTPLRIADVGGGEELLAQFLPQDDICIVDRAPQSAAGFVQGAAEALPLRDRDFDVVVCVDMLEHLPAAGRPAALQELLRISRGLSLIAAPFSAPAVHLAERLVYDFLLQASGERHPNLEEHFACGLPDLGQTVAWLRERGLETVTLPNGELYHWVLMMCASLSFGQDAAARDVLARLSAFYNQALYHQDHQEPSYRHVIVAAAPGRYPLSQLPERLRRPDAQPDRQDLLQQLAAAQTALETVRQQHHRQLAEVLDRTAQQQHQDVKQLSRLNAELQEIRQQHYDDLRHMRKDLAGWRGAYDDRLRKALEENERLQAEWQHEMAARQETLFQQKRTAEDEIARLTHEMATLRQGYEQEVARLQTEIAGLHDNYQKRIAGLEAELTAFRLPWFSQRKFNRLYQTYQQELLRLNRLLAEQQLQYSRQVQDAKADKERQVFASQQEIDRLNAEVGRLHKSYQQEIDRLNRLLREQEEHFERRLHLAQSSRATNGHTQMAVEPGR